MKASLKLAFIYIGKYYDDQGSGSPIVFLHGLYATTSKWNKRVEHLAPNHQCILKNFQLIVAPLILNIFLIQVSKRNYQ